MPSPPDSPWRLGLVTLLMRIDRARQAQSLHLHGLWVWVTAGCPDRSGNSVPIWPAESGQSVPGFSLSAAAGLVVAQVARAVGLHLVLPGRRVLLSSGAGRRRQWTV